MKSFKRFETDTPGVFVAPLSQLELWDRNYREGDVKAIARSIGRFGFNGVAKIWNDTVMAGNHAVLALRKLHSEKAPIPEHIIEDPAGGWLVPCMDVSHLSKIEAEAFAIADNHTHQLGCENAKMLVSVLEELAAYDPDLPGFAGFDADEEPPLTIAVDFGDMPSFDVPVLMNGHDVVCPECGHRFRS